jgi:proprotein convertase subtilisin/kexin type 5
MPCDLACPTCFGPTKTTCYNCQPVNTDYYYLSLGTTECVMDCPYGQYEVNGSNTCQLCSQNCATCDKSSTNCTSCSFLSSMQVLYLFNFKCQLTCPSKYWMDTTRVNDHRCTICNSACLSCVGPSTNQCQSCNNVTTLDIHNVAVTK